jgi:predicted HTH domain antitoxin
MDVGVRRIWMETATKCVHLPELNLSEDEIRMLLSMKLLEEGLVSLGKAAEIAGYSEKAFVEILIRRGVSPIRFEGIDVHRELENA